MAVAERVAIERLASAVSVTVSNVLSLPQPLLLPLQIVGGNALITWTATSNVTYRVQYTSDASLTNWKEILDDITTSGSSASKLDLLTPSNRLYRVRMLP